MPGGGGRKLYHVAPSCLEFFGGQERGNISNGPKQAAANLYRTDAVSGAADAKILADGLWVAVNCAAIFAGVEVVPPRSDSDQFRKI